MKRKGLIEFFTTPIVLLVFCVIIVIAVGLYARIVIFGPGQISQQFETLNTIENPYVVGNVLTHKQIEGRNLLEHGVEALVTDDLSRSNSEAVPEKLKEYMDSYDFKYYAVSLQKQTKGEYNKTLFYIDNVKEECIDISGRRGYCNNPIDSKDIEECNVGRVKIEGQCGGNKICCAENTTDGAYSRKNPHGLDIKRCGQNGVGICSFEPVRIQVYFVGPVLIPGAVIPLGCGEGRIKVETDECKNKNNGKTPVCCMPITGYYSEQTGLGGKMAVPLFYKKDSKWPEGMLSYLVVYVNEG